MSFVPKRTILAVWYLLATAFLLLLLELGLAVSWRNPYTLIHPAPLHTRLHQPGVTLSADAAGLYPGASRLRFSVGMDYAINGAPGRRDWAVGGSTTECGLLPEGQRWPDLLTPPAYNYGVSANSLRETYHNVRYLLDRSEQTHEPLPRRVFVLHAVNDLRVVLQEGVVRFDLVPRPLVQVAGLQAEGERRVWGLQVKDSALLSWLVFTRENWSGRRLYPHYQAEHARQAALPELDDAAFAQFWAELAQPLDAQRTAIMQALRDLLGGRGIELVFLTQPHGYRLPSSATDLRVTPQVGRSKMTLVQTAASLDRINQHTRTAAQALGLRWVDTAACVEGELGGDDVLFYDGIHFTPAGSRQFAHCLRAALTD